MALIIPTEDTKFVTGGAIEALLAPRFAPMQVGNRGGGDALLRSEHWGTLTVR